MSDFLDRLSGLSPRDALFGEVAWEPASVAPPADAAFTPSADTLAKKLEERYPWLASIHELTSYEELLPAFDELAANFVRVALRQLSFDDTVGRQFSAGPEAEALGVLPEYHRLFARLLDILASAGDLRSTDEGYVVERSIVVARMIPEIACLPDTFVADSPELAMLVRCGPALARVLDGSQDPLELLFPNGELADARRLHEDSPAARVANGLLASALSEILTTVPAGRPLRVLEIGGGTGGTTGALLDVLRPNRAEYTFTDISQDFVDRAAARFSDKPFVRYATLDIQQDPQEQGFYSGTFDVVVAANALHVTADLPAAIQRARSLVAPGGIFLLLEGTSREPWIDLTFGLMKDRWSFSDGVRKDYPLVSRDEWIGLVRDAGFEDVQVVPSELVQGRASQQAVCVARAPLPAELAARATRIWTVVVDAEDGPAADLADSLIPMLTSRGDTVMVRQSSDASGEVQGSLVYLAALDTTDANATALSTLKAVSWLRRHASAETPQPAWLVTTGAQPAGARSSDLAQWQSPLWGIGRAFALAHEAHWGGMIDLDPNAPPSESAAELLASLELAESERQIAWRDGLRFAGVSAADRPSI